MKLVIGLALCPCLLPAQTGVKAAVSEAEPPAITNFNAFDQLPLDEVFAGVPFQIEAVILCLDREWNQLYLHDGTSTRYFPPSEFPASLRVGERVHIRGKTVLRAGGERALSIEELLVTGRGVIPRARRIRPADLFPNRGEWVDIIANIRVVDTSSGRLRLVLEEGGRTCSATVMGEIAYTNTSRLLDTRVRVRGISTAAPREENRQSPDLTVASSQDVRLLPGAPANYRNTPVNTVEQLMNRLLGPWTNEPVHLRGTVAKCKPGKSIAVQDATGSIQAYALQLTPVNISEAVDLWGMLTITDRGISLSDAWFDTAERRSARRAVASTATPPAEPVGAPLTNIAQVKALTPDEADRRRPVRVRGVLTYADAEWRNGFIQDVTGSIYLDLRQKNVRPGQWVEVEAETTAGDFAPYLQNTRIRVLCNTNMPAPTKMLVPDAAGGHLDAEWVVLEGIVRRVIQDWNHARLVVTTPRGLFNALVPGMTAPTNLVNVLVRFEGACGSELNTRGQVCGITLHVPGIEHVKPLEPVPAGPFEIGSVPISSIATFSPGQKPGRRAKIAGRVSLVLPGHGFYVQDESGGIRVSPSEDVDLHSGDLVEVLGFPTLGENSPQLEEASVRIVGSGAPPVITPKSAGEVLRSATNDACLVKTRARLLHFVAECPRPKVLLQDGPVIFAGCLLARGAGGKLPDLRPDSMVELTGVCEMRTSDNFGTEAFRLLVSQPDEIKVLQVAPRWREEHTRLLLGGLSGLSLLCAGWISLLRRQVRAQTKVIAEKLEERRLFAESLAREQKLMSTLLHNLPDVVYVKERDGKCALSNRALPELQKAFSHGEVADSSDKSGFSLRDAETDRAILTGKQDRVVFDEPTPEPGGSERWHSITKVALKDDLGNITGLLGISRDITESKKTMAELAYERDLLTTLMDNLPDPIYFKDLQSHFVRVSRAKLMESYNAALTRYLQQPGTGAGRLPSELKSVDNFSLIGKTDFDILDRARAQAAFDEEQRIIRLRMPMLGKLESLPLPDGKVCWQLVTKMPWIDKNGHALGTFGISKDITPVKNSEAKLEEIHRQLLTASRQAGMAEVATTVLHNVGNVLNTVNVSAAVVSAKVKRWKADTLGLAVEMMKEHSHDLGQFLTEDPKGCQLLPYLEQLSKHLLDEQKAILSELEITLRNIEHINEIVTMQQTYAKVEGIADLFDPSELMEDALRMNSGALARHAIELVRDYQAGLPRMMVEKHKVLQVLVNLIRNAKYACEEGSAPNKQVTLSVRNGDGRIKFTVADNGVGIPAENITRIFNHGFTTRNTGHGFGLHSGALAAKEMGGMLTARSDGPGRGAAFTLELPIEPLLRA